jgi:hypothetical protein
MVLLAPDLKVRRATAAAEALLNLVPSDVGRRLTDLRAHVELADLQSLVTQVVRTVTPLEREVRDDAGRAYRMHVRPYTTRDRKIDGVVILWQDAPSGDQTRRGIADTAPFLAAIREPAAIVGADLSVVATNSAWREAHGDGAPTFPASWADVGLLDDLRKAIGSGKASEIDASAASLSLAGSRTVRVRVRPVARSPSPTALVTIFRDPS